MHELTAAESLSIDRAVKVLARRHLFLVGPARLQDCMAALCKRHGSPLEYKIFDVRCFSGIAAYNALMR